MSSATVFYLIRLLGITGIFKILNIITFLITIFKQISSINKNQTSQRYPNKEKMSTQEAHAILGVSSSASREEIVKAYKSLMLKNHPDHGGSQYIATKIIEAKHILLNNN